jgi:TRAP transporter TAXI family solute receptor
MHATHGPKRLNFFQKLVHFEWLLLTHSEQKKLLWLVLGVLASLLWVMFGVVEPPPPKTLRISTGSASGAYTLYANQYAQALKKHGITLEVVTSAGSLENLQRLDDPAQKFDLAFVQGGVSESGKHPRLEALASVAYEPIWVFFNPASFAANLNNKGQAALPQRLADLRGKRVAIDAPGSGTRAAAVQLLAMNQLPTEGPQLLPLGGMAAIEALQAGTVDAAVLVAAVASPAVQQALALQAGSAAPVQAPGVPKQTALGLINFDNADAYVRLLPWVAKVDLPKGVANLSQDLPRQEVNLIAATANLVARKDLHRAVMYLLMEVAHDVHRPASATNGRAEFPSERNLDFVQSSESKRYFVSGRPFLAQYLPFWLANFAERALVTLVPLLAIGLPLLKMIPSFMHWREYAEVVQLYDEVLVLENKPHTTEADKAATLQRLSQIDQALPSMHLGAANHMNLYNLKAHIEMVQKRLQMAPTLAVSGVVNHLANA